MPMLLKEKAKTPQATNIVKIAHMNSMFVFGTISNITNKD
jgi:hypothetical protein